MAEIGIFPLFSDFYKEKWPFPPYFWKFSKVIKYTCFRKSRKMAILRGSKLENYWSDWNEILTDKNIRRDLFNAGLRPKKYWIAAELWASQNRDFSKISKTRVFHQLSRIFENMAEIGIFPYKKIFLDFLERKNPHFRHKKIFTPYFFLIKKNPKNREKKHVSDTFDFWDFGKFRKNSWFLP